MKYNMNEVTPLSRFHITEELALEEITLDFLATSPTQTIRGRWLIPLEEKFEIGGNSYAAAYTADSLNIFIFDFQFDRANDRWGRMETYDGLVEAFGKVPPRVLGRIFDCIVAEHDGCNEQWVIPPDRPVEAEGLEYAVQWLGDRTCVYIANPTDDREPYMETYTNGVELILALPEPVARAIGTALAADQDRRIEICDQFDRRLAQGRQRLHLPRC
jgi:hypothetical protein